MTTIDDARLRDQSLTDLDWRVFPDGTVRDVFAAPSGGLARVRLGDETGPRVVLVPGVVGSKEDFVLLFPLLAAAGCRVESFDLAGHYQSAGAGPWRLDPPREHFDYQLFVDDLVAILEDGPPAHVLGYSFAGLVTELALIQRPDLFRSLTLMSAPPATGQVFRAVKGVGPLSDTSSPRRAAGIVLWGIRYNLNRTPPGRIAFVRERLETIPRSCIDDVMGLMMAMPDVADAVAGVDVPKLIAVGEHDLWPRAQHAAYAERIGARLAVYPAGHAPCETTPHQLAHDLLQLIADAE